MTFSKIDRATLGGFTFLETCLATGLAILLGAALLAGLTQCMSFAASARLMTNARAIVHRNIDAASGIQFASSSSVPPLLVPTSNAWVRCEDDANGVAGANVENILLSATNYSLGLVTGTLTRLVSQEIPTESSSAVLYRVTYKVDYTFLSKNFSYSETTLRSVDQNN